jgi:thioredoxin reductase (NADPH)
MISEKTKTIEKVIILGTGPAGLSAGLYAARADLSPLIFTGTQIGGQAALTDRIENYPGFPEGVGGNELAELFQKNAERFGARLEYDTVTKVDLSSRPFKLNTYSNEYEAQTLIITTGASPNKLNIPGEEEFLGKGVSYCATCDGWFFKEKAVVVVGGGDSALEEGIFLTRYASSVKIIHRRDELRGSKILQERAFNNPKIEFIWNSIAKEIKGSDGVETIALKNVKTGESSEIKADGFFVFIGHTPNTQIFQSQLDLDVKGYILVSRKYQTSIPGVYAAGEVCDPVYRQVITSAGMGAAAAIETTRLLEKESD